MEMGSDKTIETLKPQEEVYVCPSCNYRDGFHVSFRWKRDTSAGEIYLICPSCHSRFRIGWKFQPV
jgi:hypothetical protein